MALPSRHRKPSDHALARRIVARMCSIALPVDGQPHGCWDNPSHHISRGRISSSLRSDDLLQLPLPDTFHYRQDCHQIPITWPRHVFPVAMIFHRTLFFHRKPQENPQVSSLRSSPCGGVVRLYSGCSRRDGIHNARYCDGSPTRVLIKHQ